MFDNELYVRGNEMMKKQTMRPVQTGHRADTLWVLMVRRVIRGHFQWPDDYAVSRRLFSGVALRRCCCNNALLNTYDLAERCFLSYFERSVYPKTTGRNLYP